MIRPSFLIQPGLRIGPFALGATRSMVRSHLLPGMKTEDDEHGMWIPAWGMGMRFDEYDRCIQIIARSGWPDGQEHVDLICCGIHLNDGADRDACRELRNLSIDFDGGRWPSLGLVACGYDNGDEIHEWHVVPPRRPLLQVIGGRRIGNLCIGARFSQVAARIYGDAGMTVIDRARVCYPRYGITAHFDDDRCTAIDIALPLPEDMGLRIFPITRNLAGMDPAALRRLLAQGGGGETGPDREAERLRAMGLELADGPDGAQLRVIPVPCLVGADT